VPVRVDRVPVRVLVVDDDLNHLRLLAAGLRLEGFAVEAAADAAEALDRLGRSGFDLAIVDVMMPGVSGLELARRASRDFPDVRIVLMSAYHLSERQVRQASCGAVGFIPKPYRMEELAAYLREKVGFLPGAVAAAG
jgi:DNA-binding response OmpR family regulator